jgi:hypothetical protein
MQLLNFAALNQILLGVEIDNIDIWNIKIDVLFIQTVPFNYDSYLSECENRKRRALWTEFFYISPY